MPLGFQRLNERHQRPNTHINFIQPLPGPSSATAHAYLSRIAALMYPIMRAHHLLVNTLEEFPHNREFAGRNFNAGEAVQLVLRDAAGNWLNFRSVAMVMVHELAHCKQMNHSKFFWEERNRFADHLKVLWDRGYTGEGVWGRGVEVGSGGIVDGGQREGTLEVESLCGGAYRGRGRKRKRGGKSGGKEKVSYAERQQRRIQRKFGKHGEGNALGENEMVRSALETGRSNGAKPKVAGSKRGRELRAAAALARFDAAAAQKAKAETDGTSTEDDSGSETESDYEDDGPALVDDKGQQIKDAKGNHLIKVCDGEDMNDDNAQRELDELRGLDHPPSTKPSKAGSSKETLSEAQLPTTDGDRAKHDETGEVETAGRTESEPAKQPRPSIVTRSTDNDTTSSAPIASSHQAASTACPICSLENEPGTARCAVCAHVLDRNRVKEVWSCTSEACQGSAYLNAGDCGVCGVCGAARPKG